MVETGNTCENYPDGCLYKGCSPTYLIGQSNYQDAGDALELYLVGNPDQVAIILEICFRIAIWLCYSRDLNSSVDQSIVQAFRQIAAKTNGGQNDAA
ncbi:unnamed protein product [Adineta ricciae]|uniref:Glycoside hydrolase family 19 catalytic domain-containing protein n=1 Tax=Adineta ricciae TaxID=249248 RepID=A0A813RAM5_ADIRI|nr:unnamed protein product [Adineta ricciae]CAF1186223.1 unnamed protein product [Adineta ricciae]